MIYSTRSREIKKNLRNFTEKYKKKYDKNELYYESCQKYINLFEKEQEFHKALQKTISTIQGNEYYQRKHYNLIKKKASSFFKHDIYTFHEKKNNSYEELVFYITNKLKNKDNYYLIETDRYTKFGKSETDNMLQNLYRYKADQIKTVCFIFKKTNT
jgi:hypothetical protein